MRRRAAGGMDWLGLDAARCRILRCREGSLFRHREEEEGEEVGRESPGLFREFQRRRQ